MKKRLVDEAPAIARINVMPIIDVALVLVIILLITAPMIAATDMEVDLPHAFTRTLEDEVRVSITLGKSGELAVDDDPVTASALKSVLSGRLAATRDKNVLVVVRADAGAPYEKIHRILKDARAAGAKRIAIATRQRGRRKS